MRRYLTLSEVQSALNRGKQVEQFLNGYLANGEPAIRYAIIRPENSRVVATVYECLEMLPNCYDVFAFPNVEADTDPQDFYFDSLDEAVSFLEYNNGAAKDRYVNEGVVCEEYKDYRLTKK